MLCCCILKVPSIFSWPVSLCLLNNRKQSPSHKSIYFRGRQDESPFDGNDPFVHIVADSIFVHYPSPIVGRIFYIIRIVNTCTRNKTRDSLSFDKRKKQMNECPPVFSPTLYISFTWSWGNIRRFGTRLSKNERPLHAFTRINFQRARLCPFGFR